MSESEFFKDPMGYLMSKVLPDKWYNEYIRLKRENKDEEAQDILTKYGWSPI